MRRINESDRKGMHKEETERQPWSASRGAVVRVRLRVNSMHFRAQTHS